MFIFVKNAIMKHQELLLQEVRKCLSEEQSVIEEIAGILGISYDASHRRVAMKSKFSIEETVKLCQYFSISFDALLGDKHKVLTDKTQPIQSLSDFKNYFEQSAAHLEKYQGKTATMYYSAKDIPLFYTIGGTLLSKFKLYVWTQLLIKQDKQIPFDRFTVNVSLLEATAQLKSVYESAEVVEIWNDTTINSSLQQIYYFFESGLIAHETALLLLAEVDKIVTAVEAKTNLNSERYKLYYNELLILIITVLVSSEHQKSLFVPYNMVGYFITENKATCQEAEYFFENQVYNSKLLQSSGKRDRNLFFNRMYQKIEFYRNKVNNFINE